MNAPAINQELLISHLAAGATLLTPNKRLSRVFRQRYNAAQLGAGHGAWPSADILPVASWLARCWRNQSLRPGHTESHPAAEMLLYPDQARLLWHTVIRRDLAAWGRQQALDTSPLWNVSATANEAMRAWQICWDYDIAITHCERSTVTDHRRFAGWANDFIRQCAQHHWLDEGRLLAALMQSVSRINWPARLILADFEEMTPAQTRLFEALQGAGVEVCSYRSIDEIRDASAPPLDLYDDALSHWRSAAEWCRDQLVKKPDARLAIVCPDLAGVREQLEPLLISALSPADAVHPRPDSALPFHFALGRSLSVLPIVRSALSLLAVLKPGKHRTEHLAAIIIDPYIRGASRELAARHSLHRGIMERLAFQSRLGDLTRYFRKSASSDSPGLLHHALEQAEAFSKSEKVAGGRYSHLHWAGLFQDWLALFGWPGHEQSGLNSIEHQTVQALHRRLEVFSSLSTVSRDIDVFSAVDAFAALVEATLFEPESNEPGVDVLGLPESAGQYFDAVWLGSLSGHVFPPAPRPSPFIPRHLQIDARYPEASRELLDRRTRHQLARLQSQTGQLHCAAHRIDNGVEVMNSPLFTVFTEQPGAPPSLVQLLAQPVSLERVVDSHGSAVSEKHWRGGVGLIEDQSRCPFRAYARHRLRAFAIQPQEQGLDAVGRGQLIHFAMETLWKTLQSSEALQDLQAGRIAAAIQEAAEAASQHMRRATGSGRSFSLMQTKWLTGLLADWLQAENRRAQPFMVESVEASHALSLGALIIDLKIDRVDKLGDATRVVIDYKTGSSVAVARWVGERPDYAQLALYVLALSDAAIPNIGGAVVARVAPGAHGFSGIIDQAPFLEDRRSRAVCTPEKISADPEFTGWEDLVSHWQDTMSRHATAFAAGEAGVDPAERACQYCDLAALCRIRHSPYEDHVSG